jgi:hypothetical protein
MDQMKNLKASKQTMRLRKQDDENAFVDLLKDLEQRKERELRARLEKEEI